MTPPPIRYPLPLLAALVLLATIGWRGADAIRSLRRSFADAWQARFAPPPPRSTVPRRDGPFVRRALLLREGAEVRDEPGGPAIETIGRRGFFDVYDAWPIEGAPTDLRIGNRRAIGWVAASDLLEWNTRLVLVEPEGPVPAVDWDEDSVLVARWREGEAWRVVDRFDRIPFARIGPGRWAIWLSRAELIEWLDQCTAAARAGTLGAETLAHLRARAIAGRLVGSGQVAPADLQAIAKSLPQGFAGPGPADDAEAHLARLNEDWSTDADWSGVAYQAIPLTDLP